MVTIFSEIPRKAPKEIPRLFVTDDGQDFFLYKNKDEPKVANSPISEIDNEKHDNLQKVTYITEHIKAPVQTIRHSINLKDNNTFSKPLPYEEFRKEFPNIRIPQAYVPSTMSKGKNKSRAPKWPKVVKTQT